MSVQCVEMGTVEYEIEMLWRCRACGTRNRGRATVCQGCGKPKLGDEEYEMPGDCSSQNAVSDPELLRLAHAGPNWRCGYCGSDQRRFDGSCANCGAGQAEAKPEPTSSIPQPSQPRPLPALRALVKLLAGATGCALFIVLTFCAVVFGSCIVCASLISSESKSAKTSAPVTTSQPEPDYREVTVTITEVEWWHTLTIERYQLLPEQGWAEQKPPNAVASRFVERRVRNTTQIACGTTTETYEETVPDGYETEKYKERVQCGEDCHTTKRKCTQSCTSSRNGFARCTESCTGGNRECEPRYCDETRTRKVPKTKIVSRTRQVTRWCDKPQYDDWYEWKDWGWAEDRSATEYGRTLETKWPEPSKMPRKTPLSKGQKEQEKRSEKYRVYFLSETGTRLDYEPQTLATFQRFAPGSQHKFIIWRSGAKKCVD